MTQGDKKSGLDVAQEFAERCLRFDFFKAAEDARVSLAILLDSSFPGTESCRTFILEYDVRSVGYATNDFFPDTSPAEWLELLGIDLEKGRAGIFDPVFVREFERRKLRLYAGMNKRHPMVGFGVPNRLADIQRWEALIREWEREFQSHYGSYFNTR